MGGFRLGTVQMATGGGKREGGGREREKGEEKGKEKERKTDSDSGERVCFHVTLLLAVRRRRLKERRRDTEGDYERCRVQRRN